jgi:DNA-binding Lrp family transcriptional regulator
MGRPDEPDELDEIDDRRHLWGRRFDMAQPREQHRLATAKKKRGKKRSLLRGAAREFMTVRFGKSKRKVHISPERLSAITEKRLIEQILKGYFAVVKEAQKAGHPLDYTIRVSPDGDAKPVAAPITESDALETALAAARERGQVKVAEILKGDDMLTASDFGSLIGASHETVNVKRGRGEVLGLQGATRAVRYPRWQVTDAGLPLPGLPKLFEILGRQPWTVYRFLRTAHAELGGQTALDALKAGQQEAVLGVAQNQMSGVFT